jgi:hypothetical protein
LRKFSGKCDSWAESEIFFFYFRLSVSVGISVVYQLINFFLFTESKKKH